MKESSSTKENSFHLPTRISDPQGGTSNQNNSNRDNSNEENSNRSENVTQPSMVIPDNHSATSLLPGQLFSPFSIYPPASPGTSTLHDNKLETTFTGATTACDTNSENDGIPAVSGIANTHYNTSKIDFNRNNADNITLQYEGGNYNSNNNHFYATPSQITNHNNSQNANKSFNPHNYLSGTASSHESSTIVATKNLSSENKIMIPNTQKAQSLLQNNYEKERNKQPAIKSQSETVRSRHFRSILIGSKNRSNRNRKRKPRIPSTIPGTKDEEDQYPYPSSSSAYASRHHDRENENESEDIEDEDEEDYENNDNFRIENDTEANQRNRKFFHRRKNTSTSRQNEYYNNSTGSKDKYSDVDRINSPFIKKFYRWLIMGGGLNDYVNEKGNINKQRNYEKYPSKSIYFLFGGRVITTRDSPLNLGVLGLILIPGGLFYGFV